MKRRKRRSNVKYTYSVMLLLIVFVILGTGVCAWINWEPGQNQKKTVKNPKELILAKDESQNAISTSASLNEETKNETEHIPDRSGFSVQPQIPVGRSEQSEEKVVYLTIDDGPSKSTQKVLDILDQFQVKATFFVTNGQPEYMGLIKTAHDKGHTIGLHTYTHNYQQIYSSVDAYFQDLDAIGQAVKAQIGYIPCFIRFPGGSSNTVSTQYSAGIMTTLSQKVQQRGYQYYDWNVSSGDGAVRPMTEIRVMGTSGTQNNIVLLCHDSDGKGTTIEALPDIIQFYKNAGYEFRALNRESYTAKHGILN